MVLFKLNNSSSYKSEPWWWFRCDLNWHKILRFYTYIFSVVLVFDWEDISNTQESVSSHFQTPRSSSKILRRALYFQLSSSCLEMLMKHSLLCLIYDIMVLPHFLLLHTIGAYNLCHEHSPNFAVLLTFDPNLAIHYPYIFFFHSQFFMKATSLEQISSDYCFVMEHKEIALATLQKKEEVQYIYCC